MARVLRHQNQENAHFNMKKVAPNRLGKREMPKYKNIRKGLPLFCFPIIDSIKQINLQRFSVVKGTMTQTFFNALHLTPSNRTKYLWNRGTKFGTLQSYKITFRNVLLFALMIYNRKSNGGTFATEMSTSMLLTKLCWGLNHSPLCCTAMYFSKAIFLLVLCLSLPSPLRLG